MLQLLLKPLCLWSYDYYLNLFVYEVMILIISYNPTIRYYHSPNPTIRYYHTYSPSSIIVAIILIVMILIIFI